MSDAIPDSTDVHKLPPPKNAPRVPHQFGGEVRVAPQDSISGFEQIERTCSACDAVKVTIIDPGGNHHRAWRKGGVQLVTVVALVCEPKVSS